MDMDPQNDSDGIPPGFEAFSATILALCRKVSTLVHSLLMDVDKERTMPFRRQSKIQVLNLGEVF